MHDGIYNYPDGMYGYKDGEQAHNYGRGFAIDKISENVELGTYTYTLSTIYLGKKKIAEFPRSQLDKQYIGELAGKGFDVTPISFNVFLEALQYAERKYSNNKPVYFNHTYIGWQNVNMGGKHQMLFKSHGWIGNYPSEYIGTLNIEPKGTLQAQLEMIKSEVVGNVPLEAILAIGASAVLNGFIGESIAASTLIVHLFGDSTQGKSTAAQLAVSIAGSPDLQKSGLFMSWNGTGNGIITRMKGNKGMPVAFDEISKCQIKDMSSIVYTLADGRDKDRCNKDSTIKSVSEFDSWHTTIISTGEASLLSKCNNNTGLKIRVFEFDDVFTSSATNAENIKECIKDNYGHIAPKLAKAMIKIGHETLIRMHKKYKERFIDLCGRELKIIERIANNIAIILLSAKLMNDVFCLNLDIKAMAEYFMNNVQNNNSNRDLADEAYSKILEVVHSNKSKFAHYQSGEEFDARAYECWGKIVDMQHINSKNPDIVEQVILYYEQFCEIVKSVGFEDEHVVIKKMKEKGYLDCEKGKNYRKRKVRASDVVPSKVMVVNVIKDDILEDESDTINRQSSSVFDDVLERCEEYGCDVMSDEEFQGIKEIPA